MNNIRRNHPPAFKAQVVLALLKEEGTTNEIASKFSIHPTQATKWKTKVIDNLSHLFEDKLASDQLKEKDRMIDDLFREVGQLKMELEWLKKRLAIPIKLGQNLTLEGKKLHISGDIPFYLVEKMKNGVRQELKRLEHDKIPQLSKESLTISGVSNTVWCFLDEVRTFFEQNPEN